MAEKDSLKLPQLLRMREVCSRLGLSRSAVYDKLSRTSPRYDSTFPKPIKLGMKAVAWNEAHIYEWLNSRSYPSSIASTM